MSPTRTGCDWIVLPFSRVPLRLLLSITCSTPSLMCRWQCAVETVGWFNSAPIPGVPRPKVNFEPSSRLSEYLCFFPLESMRRSLTLNFTSTLSAFKLKNQRGRPYLLAVDRVMILTAKKSVAWLAEPRLHFSRAHPHNRELKRRRRQNHDHDESRCVFREAGLESPADRQRSAG